VLDAIRDIRERYGPDIHITGGMSNVSFGIPNRRLINDAFLVMAIEAGADSGILDPLTNPPDRALSLNRDTRPFQLALDVLTGADRHCKAYMKAFRAGELEYAA
jgi:5-methyltetrahydrofolate--homocysteine methyltransferase